MGFGINLVCLIIFVYEINCTLGQTELVPQPGEGVCGEITHSDEITSNQADLGEHPWVAALGYHAIVTDTYKFDCSGVIITEKHVLCPGHCINHISGINFVLSFVRLGARNVQLNNTRECIGNVCADPAVDIDIENRYTNFDPQWPWDKDIGVLKLVKSVKFTEWIKPICLPTATYLKRHSNYVGATFVVSGWSKTLNNETTSDIKLIKNYVVDRDEICERGQDYHYVRATSICTNRNEVPCTGDGPVMAIDSNADKPYWYVVGAFSYGPLKCERNEELPKFSTKVVPFLDWIHYTINREE